MSRLPMFVLAGLLGLGAMQAAVADAPAAGSYAVGPQYDTTHVYVRPADFDRFVASFIATFGGTTSKQGVFQVTPTPSKTMAQLVLTPVGTLSVFGFETPVPYPFGVERTGYLVTDMDAAVASAVKHGATRLVATFPDPIGRDTLIQWPGGVNMQLYWHTRTPHYQPLATVPENRVYLTPDAADAFIRDWVAYAHGKVVSDDRRAPGAQIGRPGTDYRRVRIDSGYGALVVLVSDGKLPWPYGREMTGYEVKDLAATLAKAQAAGATVLEGPRSGDGRTAAMLQFPGGYIAEVHQQAAP